jgi:broad specificity phosphatase PhoE
MKIYVIRHEATVLNEQGIINGRLQDELSDKGRTDLIRLVDKLKSYTFDKLYSSPLNRAIQTAEPIAADHNNLAITIDPRLIEVDFGSFTGKSWQSVKEFFNQPNSSEMLNTYNYDFSKFDGESYKQVEKRVRSFIDSLSDKNDSDSLIITHGGVIRWFYWILKNEKVKTFPNGSIHEFEI